MRIFLSLLLGIFSSQLFAQMGPGDRAQNQWWLSRPDVGLYKEYPYPGEEKIITRQVDEMRRAIAKHEHQGQYRRGFHAKGHACYRGKLQVADNLTSSYRFGVFASQKTYDILGRFSNGDGRMQDDAARDPRGLAIKVYGVNAPNLLPGRQADGVQDFLAVNSPVFPTRNIKDFLEFHRAQLAGGLRLATYLLTHPRTARILMKHIDDDIGSLLALEYWSGGAFQMGKKAGKFLFRPCKAIETAKPDLPAADYLTQDLMQRTSQGQNCFDMLVQIQTDAVNHPIEDPSVEWDAKLVKVGRITFPGQRPLDSRLCEEAAFSPWHTTQAHKPLGNINRVRKAVYEASITLRREHNGATHGRH